LTISAKATLFRVQIGFQQKVRHAENPVHRGADFVAHIGQKFRFGPRAASASSFAARSVTPPP